MRKQENDARLSRTTARRARSSRFKIASPNLPKSHESQGILGACASSAPHKSRKDKSYGCNRGNWEQGDKETGVRYMCTPACRFK